MNTITEEREIRRKATAEDFTPAWLVNQMLSKLSKYNKKAFQDPTKTFLDPACGNGNILIQVLKQKLDNGHSPEQSLSTIYGCDIMKDNVTECRIRLLKVLHVRGIKLTIEHLRLVRSNIVHTPLSEFPNGSLDYLDLDESITFNYRTSTPKAEEALKKIFEGRWFDKVSIEDDPLPSEKKEKKSNESKLKPIKKEEGSMLDQFADDPDFQ